MMAVARPKNKDAFGVSFRSGDFPETWTDRAE